MSIAQLRTGLRAWFEGKTRIDSWDLDVPANIPTVIDGERYPANCAIALPVRGLEIARSTYGIHGRGWFGYYLIYRFSGAAAMRQLPLNSIELLINWLLQSAIEEKSDIWDGIIDIKSDTENPVIVARVDGEDSDWLMVCRFDLDITFVSNAIAPCDISPCPDPDDPFILRELRLGLFRAYNPVTPADDETFTFDQELIIPIPMEAP